MARHQKTLVLAFLTNISEILVFCLIALLLFCLTEKNPIDVSKTKIKYQKSRSIWRFFLPFPKIESNLWREVGIDSTIPHRTRKNYFKLSFYF
jgi:hypothetical protein